MRIFVSYEGERHTLTIGAKSTVYAVKEKVRNIYHIGPDEGPVGLEQQDKKVLTLNYCGADLKPQWSLSDLGIIPGSTIKVVLRDDIKPFVYIQSMFNDERLPILEKIPFKTMTVSEFKSVVSRRSGLPVSVFQLINDEGLVMFDNQLLTYYDIEVGSVIKMETWDGWNEFLNLCIMGFATHVMEHLSTDEVIARFQMKVALYIAAHFGHVDLAVVLLRQGIRADESIGEHPSREWCKNAVQHIDTLKAAVHESAEAGQLSVLRSFVHADLCNVLAKDGNDLTALNIALRRKQKACASFLLTKQWSKINYTKKHSIPLSIFVKMKRWGDRSRERVFCFQGAHKSSIKNPNRYVQLGALVGHGVQLDGFSKSKMTSLPEKEARIEEEREEQSKFRDNTLPGDNPVMPPDKYFKQVNKLGKKVSRLGKYNKAITKAVNNAHEEEEDDKKERDISDDESDETMSRVSKPKGRTRYDSTNDVQMQEPLKLPKIDQKGQLTSQSHQNLTTIPKPQDGGIFNRQGDAGKGFVLRTGQGTKEAKVNSKSHDTFFATQKNQKDLNNNEKEKKKKEKTSKSEKLIAKAKTEGGSIPLPIASHVISPRPFLGHAADSIRNDTLDKYEKYRGLKSRDYAIKCLMVANTFTERPWLQQVHQAMSIARHGVKRVVDMQPHLFTRRPPRRLQPLVSHSDVMTEDEVRTSTAKTVKTVITV